jgi:hypothetical protein
MLLFRPSEKDWNELVKLWRQLLSREASTPIKEIGFTFGFGSLSRRFVPEARRLLEAPSFKLKNVPPSFASAIHRHRQLPPMVCVLVGRDYTLRKPTVKVTLPISNEVSTDLHERRASLLASPLRKGLNGKTGYLCDSFGRQELRRRG